MEAPPANAQKSDTPFKDVVDLAIAIARARGLDAKNADLAGRISLGLFLCRDEWQSKRRECRARTDTREVCKRAHPKMKMVKEVGGDKKVDNGLDPALSLRDDKEEARVGNLDHRLNHWTAVRDALVGAHADLFPQVATIAKTLPKSDRSNEAVLNSSRSFHSDQVRTQVRRPGQL